MRTYATTQLAFKHLLAHRPANRKYSIILALALVAGASTSFAQNYNYANYNGNTNANETVNNTAENKASNGNNTYEGNNYYSYANNYSNAEFDNSTVANGTEYGNYENNYYEDNYDEINTSEKYAENNLSIDELPHPAAANHWRTQELLFTNSLPKLETITACRDELDALGKKAINAEMMLASRNVVSQSVVDKPQSYHWCFYYSAWRLENDMNNMKLDRQYIDKLNFFLAKMKELWILARALDAAFGDTIYFGYIRRIYVDMSGRHFGRRVQVISPPLGDKGQSAIELLSKPASPLFSDY